MEECIVGQNDVENFCMAKELQKTLDVFVCSLPERECNIFVRRYFYSDSIRDISKRYGLPEKVQRIGIVFRKKKKWSWTQHIMQNRLC